MPSITCLLFDEAQSKALGSIVSMLAQYLAQSWEVDTEWSSSSRIVLINLDHLDHAALMAALSASPASVVGCAERPRLQAPGTIHRPFRAYEILSLLKEYERTTSTTPAVKVPEAEDPRSFRLVVWPFDFLTWPREWWQVMAAIRTRSMSLRQIADDCALDPRQVALCIERLLVLDAATVKYDVATLDAALARKRHKGFWKRIGAQVSERLRQR
jgi:hypothetical protein